MTAIASVTSGIKRTTQVARHSPGILLASLMVGLSTWGVDHAEHGWAALTNPEHVFSLMGVIGAVLIGYFGGRPAKV